MVFTIEIRCDNSAFHDESCNGHNGPDDPRDECTTAQAEELRRILLTVVDRITNGRMSGTCRDVNGNTVGSFGLGD